MGTRRTAAGFTLIELLVVIAIIALLIGILLPSLAMTREAGRDAVCKAHLRGVGTGINVYAAGNKGFLPGPNTSGAQLTIRDAAYVFQGGATEPAQNQDWVSPTLGDSFGLPGDRLAKLGAIFNLKFKCPSNRELFGAQYDGPALGQDPTKVTTPSYQANWWFTWCNPDTPPFTGAIYADTKDVAIPPGYTPKLDFVGAPSTKIWGQDGTRWVARQDGDGGSAFQQVDFNTGVNQAIGNSFFGNSPTISYYDGSPYYRVKGQIGDIAKRFAYRHGGRLNAVFFDGHVKGLDDAASRPAAYYFPTGTVVKFISRIDDKTLKKGDIIP